MTQVNIDLSALPKKILPKFYPLLKVKEPYLVVYGGNGSGKSRFLAQKFLVRILYGFKTGKVFRFLCLRKTSPACRRSIFQEYRDVINQWGLKNICNINKSDLTISFINGSEILFSGLDEPEKVKSIASISSIHLEEATEFSLQDFIELDLRLRGQSDIYKQIMFSFNPISKLNWTYQHFFQREVPGCFKHHSTWRDNPYVFETYQKKMEYLKEVDPNKYKIASLGEWGDLADLIYQNWQILKEWNIKTKETVYGIDVGYNDPSVVLKIDYYDDNFFVEEKLYQTKLTNDDLIAKLKEIIPKKDRERVYLYQDSAEPARIEEIRRAGFLCLPAQKSVSDGIDFIKRHKLFIHPESTNLQKEIQSYNYMKDKTTGLVTDKPIAFNDHAMDSLRYGIYTHWGKPQSDLEIAWS